MNEIVKIDPKEFGLEKKQAETITTGLVQILDERKILSKEYSKVVEMEITEENIPVFKALRLQISKNRTRGIEVWRKTNKEYWLRGGQFIDAVGRKESSENIRMEDALRTNEEHFENLEIERIEKLQEKRSAIALKYGVEFPPENLGKMDNDVWSNYEIGFKASYKSQLEVENKAEKDRIAKEKAEKIERERVAKENEQLKKDAEAREKKAEKDRLAREKKEEIRVEAEEKEREKQEKILQKERDEKAKIESELQAKKDAELKAKSDEEERIQAELNKGDAAKKTDLINELVSIKTKYSFKSKKNQKMYEDVHTLIDKVINHIK